MKNLVKFIFATAFAFLVLSCSKFDDSALWEAINKNAEEIAALKEKCNNLNSDISSLRQIVEALKQGDYIKDCVPLSDGSGYTIIFKSGKSIVIKNGEKGEDGVSPQIGVTKDTDDQYYWTLNGEWLLDKDGNKVRAEGQDGKDGITPKLKIENGDWYLSVDNGATWTKLGKATGKDGMDGDSLFRSVTPGKECITFVLNDGTVLQVPYYGVTVSVTGVSSDLSAGAVTLSGWCYQKEEEGISVVYGFEYSATDLTTGGRFIIAQNINEEGFYTVRLNGLKQNTKYYFRSYVLFNGLRTYGVVKSFTTSDVNVNVMTGDVSDLAMFSAVLSGCMTTYIQEVDKDRVCPFFILKQSKEEIESSQEAGRIKVDPVYADGEWIFSKSFDIVPGETYFYLAGVNLYGEDFFGEIKSFTALDYTYTAVAVDLGLSVKWSSYNLGATAPEGIGARYAWGELNHKTTYSSYNYLWQGGDFFYSRLNHTTLLPEHDVAHVKLGGNWRIPTEDELNELLVNCSWTWITVNGMLGCEVKSKINDNTIFLPACGSKGNDEVKFENQYGYYWTSSKGTNDTNWARYFIMYTINNGSTVADSVRWSGHSIRPVCD